MTRDTSRVRGERYAAYREHLDAVRELLGAPTNQDQNSLWARYERSLSDLTLIAGDDVCEHASHLAELIAYLNSTEAEQPQWVGMRPETAAPRTRITLALNRLEAAMRADLPSHGRASLVPRSPA